MNIGGPQYNLRATPRIFENKEFLVSLCNWTCAKYNQGAYYFYNRKDDRGDKDNQSEAARLLRINRLTLKKRLNQ
jgi:hypothetical protein